MENNKVQEFMSLGSILCKHGSLEGELKERAVQNGQCLTDSNYYIIHSIFKWDFGVKWMTNVKKQNEWNELHMKFQGYEIFTRWWR